MLAERFDWNGESVLAWTISGIRLQCLRFIRRKKKSVIPALVAVVAWAVDQAAGGVVQPFISNFLEEHSPDWLEESTMPLVTEADGRLAHAGRATPDIVRKLCSRLPVDPSHPDTLAVVAGADVYILTSGGGSGTTLLRRGSEPVLRIKRTPGGYLDVFTTVYNSRGAPVASVAGQQKFEKLEPVMVRRNKSALRIIDGTRGELFYIKFINAETAVVRGTFHAPSGSEASSWLAQDGRSKSAKGGSMAGNCFADSSVGIDLLMFGHPPAR